MERGIAIGLDVQHDGGTKHAVLLPGIGRSVLKAFCNALFGKHSEVITNAYKGVAEISFDGAYYRKDIGAKALKKR